MSSRQLHVGLIRARRTNRDPITRAARPLRMFACLALSRPNLPDSVLRGTTLGSHFTLFRLSLNKDLGPVLEVKLEKTIKLMFALVLYVLQMHVL